MAKCLVSISEETVALLVAAKRPDDANLDAVVRRILSPPAPLVAIPAPPPKARPAPVLVEARRTGRHAVEVFGERRLVHTAQDVLITVLEVLARRDSGFLPRLAREQSRTRRVVAREREALYPGSPHLAKYARDVGGGWWVGTNVSRRDIERAVAACRRVESGLRHADIVVTWDARRDLATAITRAPQPDRTQHSAA